VTLVNVLLNDITFFVTFAVFDMSIIHDPTLTRGPRVKVGSCIIDMSKTANVTKNVIRAVDLHKLLLSSKSIDKVGQLFGCALVSEDNRPMKSLNHDTRHLSRHDCDVVTSRL